MWLTIETGNDEGETVEVRADGFLIGRDDSCDLTLRDEKVSRRHAFLLVGDDGRVDLQDLRSTNGVYVNGDRVDGSMLLKGDERIRIGDTVLQASLIEARLGIPGGTDTGPPDPRIGTLIDRYRVTDLIAEGGMGVVYMAEHTALGTKVALKLLSARYAQDQKFRKRFEGEWKRAASLDHANILAVHDAGEAAGEMYIAMPYIHGTDLATLIEEHGRLGVNETLDVLGQIGKALDAAHDNGLIHRDVKPGNILVASGEGRDPKGHAYLCDFGISRRMSSMTSLTQVGQTVGTSAYMAPEQIEGPSEAVDGRTDLYALGCVFYECLSGKVPFEADSDVAIYWAHMHKPPPKVSDLGLGLPVELDAVIATAMAKHKENRYATCGEFIAAAKEAVGELRTAESTTARATTADSTRQTAPDLSEPAVPPAPGQTTGDDAHPAKAKETFAAQVEAPPGKRRETVAAQVEAPSQKAHETVAAQAEILSVPPDAPGEAEPVSITPRPQRRSRLPLVLSLVGFVAVAAAVVVFLVSRNPSNPHVPAHSGSTPTASPTPLEPFPNTAEADLLQHVPSVAKQSCSRSSSPTPTTSVLASVICSAGPQTAVYTQYGSETDMNDAFDQVAADAGFQGFTTGRDSGACRSRRAFYEYSIAHSFGGQLLCYPENSGTGNGTGFYMYWTDVRLNILSSGFRDDFNQPAIYSWWLHDSGPFQ
ncbi:MAG: protein kinase [Actinomycetota bacterium]